MTMTATQLPGYVAGSWTVDPSHSEVSFVVRHLMVSKVRGQFRSFEGHIVTGDDPLQSSVTATVDLTSIDTGNEQRDGHIRGADFFDTDANRTMTYRSSGIREEGDHFVLDGELTLRGVTKPLPLVVELNGFGPDAWGGTRVGFTAIGELNRRDFGVNWNAALEGGGVVVGDKVQIQLEIEAVLDAPAS